MKKIVFISMVLFVLTLILSCSVFAIDASENLRVASTRIEGQNIIVEFTENITSVSFTNTKVYRVNGKTQLITSTPIVIGNKLKIPFVGALTPGNEYMIEFPDGVLCESRNIYFMSDEIVIEGKHETFDNNYNSSTGLVITETSDTVKGSGSEVVAKGGKEETAGLLVKTPQSTSDTSLTKKEYQVYVNNVDIPQADTVDVQVVEFDIKASNDINIPFLLQFYNSSGKLISFGRSVPGNIVGFYHTGFNWFVHPDVSRVNSATLHVDGSPLSFTDKEWKHIKLEWDVYNQTGKFYVNGQQAAPKSKFTGEDTNIETGAGDFGSIASVKFFAFPSYQPGGNAVGTQVTESGVEMFVLDNFQTYGYIRKPGVSTVRFNSKDNEKIGPYSTLRSSLETIEVSFNGITNIENSQLSNIKLYYNDVEIPYTAYYDADSKCYAMTPEPVEAQTGEYRVEIVGLKTVTGEEIENYTCGVKLNSKVIIYFDGVPYNYTVIEIDDYPAMAIEDLAEMIGGRDKT